MPIQVIEPRRLYLQIADQIRSLIAAEEFPAGSRLPAERELAKRFGVSRPSLREALVAPEVGGYVDVRPGSGIVVLTSNVGHRIIRVRKDRSKSCGLEVSLREQSQRKLPGHQVKGHCRPRRDSPANGKPGERRTGPDGRRSSISPIHASKLGNKPILRLVPAYLTRGTAPWLGGSRPILITQIVGHCLGRAPQDRGGARGAPSRGSPESDARPSAKGAQPLGPEHRPCHQSWPYHLTSDRQTMNREDELKRASARRSWENGTVSGGKRVRAGSSPALPHAVYEYVAGGAGDEHSIRAKRQATKGFRLRPRVLRSAGPVDLGQELFGRTFTCARPARPSRLPTAHAPGGRTGCSSGRHPPRCTFCPQLQRTVSIEEIMAVPGARCWFQLYVQGDRGFTRDSIARVEAAGAEAVCVTVDTPVLGLRPRQMRAAFSIPADVPLPHAKRLRAASDPGCIAP